MQALRIACSCAILAFAGCAAPSQEPDLAGSWTALSLEPGEATAILLPAVAADQRGELELRGVVEDTTWLLVADGRELAAGRLHAATEGLFGLHAHGPLSVALTLPSTVPAATLWYRMRLRPEFDSEEDEALAGAPSICSSAGCTGVIGWPADIDTYLVSPQGGAGTELRLTGVPGVAWELRVNEGANLRAQAASLAGEGTSVIVPGGGNNVTVTVRSRSDAASHLPYRLSLRGLGGPLAKP
ncbi:MAG: hypothetical protein HQ461_02175 [Deltaproteobacteria bacterium]|nr:hypothetical protein [Deltaproteobacteria bacterium]